MALNFELNKDALLLKTFPFPLILRRTKKMTMDKAKLLLQGVSL